MFPGSNVSGKNITIEAHLYLSQSGSNVASIGLIGKAIYAIKKLLEKLRNFVSPEKWETCYTTC